MPSEAALRPSAAKIWRVKSATEVLPLVPVTATIVSGCAAKKRAAIRASARRGSADARTGTPLGAGDIGARLDEDRGRALGDRIGDEARAVGLGAGQRGEQPARPHLAAVGREAGDLDVSPPWRGRGLGTGQHLELHCPSTWLSTGAFGASSDDACLASYCAGVGRQTWPSHRPRLGASKAGKRQIGAVVGPGRSLRADGHPQLGRAGAGVGINSPPASG